MSDSNEYLRSVGIDMAQDNNASDEGESSESTESDAEAGGFRIKQMVDKLDQEGEDLKDLLSLLIASGRVDVEAAKELQMTFRATLSEIFDEHEEISAPEAALAMWMELNVMSDHIQRAGEEHSVSEEAESDPGQTSRSMMTDGGNGDTDNEDNDGSSARMDPTFQ